MSKEKKEIIEVCECNHQQACKICAESKDIDWSIIEDAYNHEERYIYSEGYVYQGEDTICKMYGTDEEMELTGTMIAKFLTQQTTKDE